MTELIPIVVDNAIRLIDHVGPCVSLVLANWAILLVLHRANSTRLGRIETAMSGKD